MATTLKQRRRCAAVRQERRRARAREGRGVFKLELSRTLVLLLLESIHGHDHGLDFEDHAVIEKNLANWLEKSCINVTRDAPAAELHDLLIDEIRRMGARSTFVG